LRTNSQAGFTVIEVMAALVVFSLLTLGLTPLLLSSIKGSALSQSYTVGKNFALETMERVRGLPYYVSNATQKVDVLDLYYPSYVAGGTYTTVCTSETTAVAACPKNVPDDYSVTFDATFVEPDGDITAETYSMVLPPTTYRWDSATADLPRSQILEFRVTVNWTHGGDTKSSSLRTLISDRKFGESKLRGDVAIDYGIEVQTGYVDPAGSSSVLTATAGKADSLIESKTITTSQQTARSTELRLSEVPPDATAIGADIDFREGAKGVFHAPPNTSPADTSLAAQSLTHPNLDPQAIVASFESTAAKNLDVGVTNELPFANGDFAVGNPGSDSDDLWVAPQVSIDAAADLHLNTSRPMFIMKHSGSEVMTGGSDAVATALNSMDRKVLATGEVSFKNLRLLPTDFVSSTGTERAVVVIDDFTASVSCKSTADPTTAGASATWSATLRYWQDTTNNGSRDGSYATKLLSGAASLDLLADVRATGNPLVYDGLTPDEDVYLFEDPAAGKVGYLNDWGSLFNASSTGVTEDAAGKVTTAGIDGALSIKTAAHGTIPESALSVNLGKLSCEAVDRR
jgi:prepilin-type N-terminal cleavage/methylation domain-containing protein